MTPKKEERSKSAPKPLVTDQNTEKVSEAKVSARATIIAAIITLIGTLGAAYIGYLAINSQLKKPESIKMKLHSTYPDGAIVHNSDGSFQTVDTGAKLQDFVVDVDFFVPYSDHLWNNVITFHDGSRIWIISTGEYGYGYFQGGYWNEDDPAFLPVDVLNLSMGSSNHMRFIASGNLGCLYVNGILAEFILPVVEPSNISIGISEIESKIEGASTRYENLSVYTLMESIESCPK